jgi:hypothetical protein
MAVYNRKRRSEFFDIQRKMEGDSLEAARLAYMTGKANERQVELVEEAEARAKQSGRALPPLLGRPQAPAGAAAITGWTPPARGGQEEVWGDQNDATSSHDEAPKPKAGLRDWLFSGLKKEDSVSARKTTVSEQAAGFATSASQAKDSLKEQAKAALNVEREHQKAGGALDQVGLESTSETKKPKAVGWW